MNSSLATSLRRLNRIKKVSRSLEIGLLLFRAALFFSVAAALWSLVRPGQELEQLTLGALTFVITLVATWGRGPRKIEEKDLVLSLDMDHPETRTTALNLRNPNVSLETTAEWQPILEETRRSLWRSERSRLFALLSTLVLPLAVSFVTVPKSAPSLQLALSEVSHAVSKLNRGATLTVLEGSPEGKKKKTIPLDEDDPASLELLKDNQVKVTVSGSSYRTTPVVELRKKKDETFSAEEPKEQTAPENAEDEKQENSPEGKEKEDANAETKTQTAQNTSAGESDDDLPVFQRFQMMPVRSDSSDKNEEETDRYSISFAITEPVKLYIPAVASDDALADITVKKLPVPKVKLSLLSKKQDPWPDDEPLNLKIQVKAKNPLQKVRLLIRTGRDKVSKELVANIMSKDKHKLETDYELLLEPYIHRDLANVEVVAEAIDRAVPRPLSGYSKPIKLNTASAYGRYQKTLQTLRQVKSSVDQAVTDQKGKLPQEGQEKMKKAAKQSHDSPYFDGLDRVQLQRFNADIGRIQDEPSHQKLLEVSEKLNDFLFEHEILDDRQRDRDFFVAARSLSRLIEKDRDERPVAVPTVTKRLKRFLDKRRKRWAKRVERLGKTPPTWPEIKNDEPFKSAMNKIESLNQKKTAEARTQQLETLSQAVVDYRSWIDELENMEDEARKKQRQKRQQGLANAREMMRDLQKRQGEISEGLDKAADRNKEKMKHEWPAMRMKQNTNVETTGRLEAKLRSLSPTAGNRIKAALKAMKSTQKAGNTENFVLAESSSDLAGRLLRQAQRDARKSQQQQRRRGRRRRVTGDNYYGQSVVGGDIEIRREYKVDRRYREAILEEVRSSGQSQQDQDLLENYLRKMVR